MPVIKREGGFNFGTPFTRIIRVDSHGAFSCDLPPQVASVLGYGRLTAGSLDEILKKWKVALEEFNTAATKIERVIRYTIRQSCYIWRNEKVLHQEDTLPFCRGVGLSVFACVMDHHITTMGDKRVEKWTLVDSNIPKSMQLSSKRETWEQEGREIPWSTHRELFFSRIGHAMEEIILSLNQLDDKSRLMDIADTGNFKLIGGGK